MFNLIAIGVTFSLLTYAAYKDITHPQHMVPGWIWCTLFPAGIVLLILRASTFNLLTAFTFLYTVIFMVATCTILTKVKDREGHPQLEGADVLCFISLTVLFPFGLVPFWVALYSLIPFIVLTKLGLIGKYYPFLPFILLALPFAIITGFYILPSL